MILVFCTSKCPKDEALLWNLSVALHNIPSFYLISDFIKCSDTEGLSVTIDQAPPTSPVFTQPNPTLYRNNIIKYQIMEHPQWGLPKRPFPLQGTVFTYHIVSCPTGWSLYWYLGFCDDLSTQITKRQQCSTLHMEWWQIPIQGKNYDTSWDLNKGSPKISKMHTSKKVDSVDSGIRRQFWIFCRKISENAKSIKINTVSRAIDCHFPLIMLSHCFTFY